MNLALLLHKSMDWFLCDNGLRHERVKAGKLKHYFHKWKELTSDKEILQCWV